MKNCLSFLICFLVFLSMPLKAEWHEFSAEVMTTNLSLEFWLDDKIKAEKAKRAVLNRFNDIEAKMSRYISESELSKVNRLASEQALSISTELFSLLEKSLAVSALSQGAFDISFASVGFLYDYRQQAQPSDSQINAKLPALDYRHIVLNRSAQTVRFSSPGVVLDLGGIAKGYAVDEGIKMLKTFGVKHARLSAGGDMYLLGGKGSKPWLVAVRHPRNKEENSVVLPLSDVALSTSGDYERFFIDDSGERVHHIISPKTGRSARNGLLSVSVLGPDVTTTDALSTAVFVLGLKKGLDLINKLEGIDAIMIDERQRVHYSNGLGRP